MAENMAPVTGFHTTHRLTVHRCWGLYRLSYWLASVLCWCVKFYIRNPQRVCFRRDTHIWCWGQIPAIFFPVLNQSDCLGACDIFFSRCFVDKERGVSRQVYVSSVPQHHIVAAVLQHRELSTTIKQVFFDIFPSSQPWNCSKNIIVVTTDPHYRISNTLYIVNWCRFYPYYSCKSWL